MSVDSRRPAGLRHALGLLALAGLAGCGAGATPTAEALPPEALGLQSLGEAYRTISVVNKRPPKGIKEVEQASAASPGGMGSLDESNVVVFWGAELNDLSEEPGKVPSDKVLAYEKKVPTQGGYVLLLDRTIKKMTPEEFKSAPKAGTAKGS